MIRLDRPPENTNQSGVDDTWTLNISGPVGRKDCRQVPVLNGVEAVMVYEPFYVQFVTSYDPSKLLRIRY